MSTVQYELHLNLQQRAALRATISFWKRKEIKDKLAGFFKSCEKLRTYKARKKLHEFTKSVIDEWKKDVLPKMLEAELIHIIKMIGETIFNWYQYIKDEYGAAKDAISFIDEIKWTPYGTMDEVQIFKSSWLDNPNVDITKVYNFACRYAITDHINKLWNKIPRNIRNDCYKDIYKHFDQHILAYWKHCRDNNLPNLMRRFQLAANNFDYENRRIFNLLYDLSRSIEENMLWLSIYESCFIAMQYFWEKLSEEERDDSVLKCARIAVHRYYSFEREDTRSQDYKRSQCVEISFFLINQMTIEHKMAFLNNNLRLSIYHPSIDPNVKDDILRMILSVWPWQELFIPVLKDMLHYHNDDSPIDCKFLSEITSYMSEYHEVGYSLESSKYRYLLRKAWLIIPASIKRKMKIIESPTYEFISNLIRVGDLDSLKLILNDSDITDIRDEFINKGSFSYNWLIKSDEFQKLDQFIEEIIRSEEEKKQFRQRIDVWSSLLKEGKFDLADKLLDWQSSTPEERQSIKNNIDHIEICERVIDMEKYDLADEFLDWKFDTAEEKRKCKNHFKSDIFSIWIICEFWEESSKNINFGRDRCDRFLRWFLESEEEIVFFKKGIIAILESNGSTMDHLVRLKSVGVIDVFFYWCLLNDEEFQQIQRIKQSVAQSNIRP